MGLPTTPDASGAATRALDALCPLVREWFEGRFAQPTDPQLLGWPAIARGEDTLITAPTGSGKTLAAFLLALDGLVRRGLKGALKDQTEVIYVSPMRALSHDVHKNLEGPLAELRELDPSLPEVRVFTRSGDTLAQ